MARPNKGLRHVDALTGDPETKWRLQLILATLSGEMFVEEACEELEIGPTQFATLRRRVLQGALDALEPRPIGRPSKEVTVSVVEVAALRERNAELEQQLTEMRARVELAILPFLGKRRRGKRGPAEPEEGP
jgi:transposase-like protein